MVVKLGCMCFWRRTSSIVIITIYFPWNGLQKRYSIDIIIRFLVSTITGFVQIVDITILGHGNNSWYDLGYSKTLKALGFTFIAFLTEFLYFTLVISLNIKCYTVNIIEYYKHAYGKYTILTLQWPGLCLFSLSLHSLFDLYAKWIWSSLCCAQKLLERFYNFSFSEFFGSFS